MTYENLQFAGITKSTADGCAFSLSGGCYLVFCPSSRLDVWIYRVSKKTVGTNRASTVASRPRKLVSINLRLIAYFKYFDDLVIF
jgi:hypothetical protein